MRKTLTVLFAAVAAISVAIPAMAEGGPFATYPTTDQDFINDLARMPAGFDLLHKPLAVIDRAYDVESNHFFVREVDSKQSVEPPKIPIESIEFRLTGTAATGNPYHRCTAVTINGNVEIGKLSVLFKIETENEVSKSWTNLTASNPLEIECPFANGEYPPEDIMGFRVWHFDYATRVRTKMHCPASNEDGPIVTAKCVEVSTETLHVPTKDTARLEVRYQREGIYVESNIDLSGVYLTGPQPGVRAKEVVGREVPAGEWRELGKRDARFVDRGQAGVNGYREMMYCSNPEPLEVDSEDYVSFCENWRNRWD